MHAPVEHGDDTGEDIGSLKVELGASIYKLFTLYIQSVRIGPKNFTTFMRVEDAAFQMNCKYACHWLYRTRQKPGPMSFATHNKYTPGRSWSASGSHLQS